MPELVSGFYGKLPARNDFVSAALDPALVSGFDQWLSDRLAIARRSDPQAGTGFKPWRFAIAAGVLAPTGVIGVLSPSRDGVGRSYPLALIQPLAPKAGALATAAANPGWFAAAEALITRTIADRLEPKGLLAESTTLPGLLRAAPPLAADGNALTLGPSGGLEVSLAAMVARLLANRPQGHSLWWTAEASASLLCDGLPSAAQAGMFYRAG